MKIGVLGAGAMASVLAGRWSAAGHELFIGARNAGAARTLAARLGVDVPSGSLRDAALFGDVALLAIWPTGVIAALLQAGAAEGTLAGRVVVDCNNPVETRSFTLTTGEASLAEQIARLAPGASVVKAFNQCQAGVWAMDPPHFDGRPLTVPLCGNDPASKDITPPPFNVRSSVHEYGGGACVTRLIQDLGCRALDVGPLHRARHLEAMAAVVIGLLFSGTDPLTVFNLVSSTAPSAPLENRNHEEGARASRLPHLDSGDAVTR